MTTRFERSPVSRKEKPSASATNPAALMAVSVRVTRCGRGPLLIRSTIASACVSGVLISSTGRPVEAPAGVDRGHVGVGSAVRAGGRAGRRSARALVPRLSGSGPRRRFPRSRAQTPQHASRSDLSPSLWQRPPPQRPRGSTTPRRGLSPRCDARRGRPRAARAPSAAGIRAELSARRQATTGELAAGVTGFAHSDCSCGPPRPGTPTSPPAPPGDSNQNSSPRSSSSSPSPWSKASRAGT